MATKPPQKEAERPLKAKPKLAGSLPTEAVTLKEAEPRPQKAAEPRPPKERRSSTLSFQLWEYRAFIKRWVDGDTVDVEIDLGFGIRKLDRLRLARIDAWEKRGDERVAGLAATDFVITMCPPESEILIRTAKDKQGKYGRYLAEIYFGPDRICLNDLLVESGHAEYASY